MRVLLYLLTCIALAGCSPDQPRDAAAPPPPQPPTRDSLTVTDGRGRAVTVALPVERVVSLAPSTTELVFALGAGERLAARTRFCQYPPEAISVPSVGGMVDGVDHEQLLALNPDLVLVSDIAPPEQVRFLEQLGLTVAVANHAGLAGLMRDIEMTGTLLGTRQQAAALAWKIETARASAARRAAAFERPPRVLVTLGIFETFSAGEDTYVDSLIREAGGVNLAANAASPWPRLSMESILAGDPEVLIISREDVNGIQKADTAILARYRAHPAWSRVQAVRAGHVWSIDSSLLNIPGPRVAKALKLIADILAQSTASS